MQGTSLRGGNFSFADMFNVQLDRTKVNFIVGDNHFIKSLHLGYKIAYTNKELAIGCQQHLIKDWWGFTDIEIYKMDKKALDWWCKWRNVLRDIIEEYPARSI